MKFLATGFVLVPIVTHIEADSREEALEIAKVRLPKNAEGRGSPKSFWIKNGDPFMDPQTIAVMPWVEP